MCVCVHGMQLLWIAACTCCSSSMLLRLHLVTCMFCTVPASSSFACRTIPSCSNAECT